MVLFKTELKPKPNRTRGFFFKSKPNLKKSFHTSLSITSGYISITHQWHEMVVYVLTCNQETTQTTGKSAYLLIGFLQFVWCGELRK